MDYQQKYIKYKQKYVELKNLIGASRETAKNYFISNAIKNFENIISIIKNDKFLTSSNVGMKLPEKTDNDDVKKILFNKIFDKLVEYSGDYKKNIDWIIKSYISNTFGNPSSIENIGRFKNSIEKYNLLKKNIKTIHIKYADFNLNTIDKIDGLIALEKYINENTEMIQFIGDKNINKLKKKKYQIEIQQKGENPERLIFETKNIKIYAPQTQDESKYYGRNTAWCTAANNHCRFHDHYSKGPLYIIQSKKNITDKYQINVPRNEPLEIKDSSNKSKSLKHIMHHFNDTKLNSWLYDFVHPEGRKIYNERQKIKEYEEYREKWGDDAISFEEFYNEEYNDDDYFD